MQKELIKVLFLPRFKAIFSFSHLCFDMQNVSNNILFYASLIKLSHLFVGFRLNCHNPNNNSTQHNLNIVVGLDPPPTKETQWWPQGDSD